MSEFLTQLLQAVIIAAITVCASFLIRFLNQKSGQIAAETDSVELKNLLEQVTDAVTTAVTYTSQTFVDALKKEGLFDADAQKEALQKSLDKAVSLLSETAQSTLEEIYGNLNDYLTSKIEAEVRSQKITLTAVTGSAAADSPETVVVESRTGVDPAYAIQISELMGMSAAELKKKAEECGANIDGLTQKKDIAQAIITTILSKA